jgi:hypothetical protein
MTIRDRAYHQIVADAQEPFGHVALPPGPLRNSVVHGDFGERQEQNNFKNSNQNCTQDQRPEAAPNSWGRKYDRPIDRQAIIKVKGDRVRAGNVEIDGVNFRPAGMPGGIGYRGFQRDRRLQPPDGSSVISFSP